jgi:large conductance mechanosensitive channel
MATDDTGWRRVPGASGPGLAAWELGLLVAWPEPDLDAGGHMLKEFRDFINRGNLIDLAVAFVTGVAFAGVVTSLTEGIVTPLIGRVFRVDNLQTYVVAGDVEVGRFLAAVLNFLVVAFVMFLVVKAYNKTRGPAALPADPAELVLLREIRDELKSR